MPWKIIGALVLKRFLGDQEVKKRVFEALRYQAGQTTTKIDDGFVDTFEAAWDVVVPALVGKTVK